MVEQPIVASVNLFAEIIAEKVIQRLKEYSVNQKRNTQRDATQPIQPQTTQTQTSPTPKYKSNRFRNRDNDTEDPNEGLKKKITEMLNSLGDRKAECINYLKQNDALYNKNSTKKQILRTYAIIKEFIGNQNSDSSYDYSEADNPF